MNHYARIRSGKYLGDFPENDFGIPAHFPCRKVDTKKSLNKEMRRSEKQPFKTCPMCSKIWSSRETFLSDPELVFIGYQANFGIMEQGLFYFTHENEGCGSTMVIQADKFLSLYHGEIFNENKYLSEACAAKCLEKTELDRCMAQCEFAFVREVSQILKDRFGAASAKR